ncbi:hypothetical protein GobsT_49750 [Gemmata obscuriglobus]|uniref:Type I-MYXAN CRISPR-associated protein Cmx8 n=1 Tax=Gemmata obscuriglobus TaxID=114 RepID=A0A2Z3H633_9BACT|nr:type I-MYXAN CRISPR-associated protein Cmx8 [Gemmata obscuriglobus]AWM37104.1 type I-MYXAN CRISPR-associated protein Cmx8 [Gemmata obscuriglobus]QEG30173.1 hypothetical protein GobsT_49750 [Gemmata obscuriglobus]VTS09495.1 Uncharacterized protein OS=Desulfococcus multivorans DSM 2059 GN=dsmv_2502 PE=4 SV=1 [Gemmata obscuriglobus UQM 2246]
MAKTKQPPTPKSKSGDPSEVEVRYDLSVLPTAFHKAGLAGLVLLIESLKQRRALTAEETKCTVAATEVTVTFTEPLLQKLMDDLYDAREVEVAVKSKWQGAEVKREETVEEEVDGKKTRTKRFIYDQVQPKGAFFDNVFDGDKEIWRKLWRDMLWNIPRGRPTTREPFNQRASGKPCKEGPNAWSELLKVHKARTKKEFHTAALSSALFPGAQAVNAEAVPFEGRAEENLLLHFWPLTALLYVPQEIERDGSTNLPASSYTVAVPDVSDLCEFVTEYPKLLTGLSAEVRGYRPAQAVIDLPAEGALAFLEDLAVLTRLEIEAGKLRFSIGAVEYLHLVKAGNNVKLMAAGRVAPDQRLLVGYRAIVRPTGTAPHYRNSLFRRGLLLALLDGESWYQPFGRSFVTFDAGVFIRQPRKDDEKGPPQFASDASKKFRHLTTLFTQTLEMAVGDSVQPPKPLELLVEQVIKSYLLGKAKAKCNIDKKTKLSALGKDEQKKVYDKKRDIAAEAFLAARSRRDQDFVKYFSEVICSAGTYFDKKTSDFQVFATALNDPNKTDSIKALTLLALSANS